MNNRKHNSTNPYQGNAKRVLCVCSAGLLRSPTAAIVIQRVWGHNTRAAGLSEGFALIVVDDVLLHWADEVVCMELDQLSELQRRTDKPIICLNVEDSYPYMDEKLQELVEQKYRYLTEENA